VADNPELLPDEPPYNPRDKENLAASIAEALLRRPAYPLDLPIRFRGVGIYAIYYFGNLELYAPLATLNQGGVFRYPIYVGKAEPKGKRKGAIDESESERTIIYDRLRKHANCISEVRDLDLKHFQCRYLIIDLAFVSLEERLLISKYRPVWNSVVEGFGINVPGKGRKDQKKSEWDTIHVGRELAKGRQPSRRSREQILEEVRSHLANIRDPIT
jgi:hypothetical protein